MLVAGQGGSLDALAATLTRLLGKGTPIFGGGPDLARAPAEGRGTEADAPSSPKAPALDARLGESS